MAQYFYDFGDLVPGTSLPAGLVGLFGSGGNSNFYQAFSRENDGMVDWLKNSDAGTGNYTVSALYGPDAVATDVECLVKLVAIHYNGGSFSNDGPALFCRVNSRSNYQYGYEIALPGAPAATTSFARKRIADVPTTLTGGLGGISRESPVWIRFGIAGTQARLKTWAVGASEPAAWGQTWEDAGISAAGYFGFGIRGASGTGHTSAAGRRYKIFQLSFGTGSDAAPSTRPGGSRTVAGTAHGADDSVEANAVLRVYARANGVLLATTLTDSSGAFSVAVPYAGEVTVVLLDAAGGTRNAVIKDLINLV